MLDPGSIPLADLLGPLSSLVAHLLVVVSLLVLWEVAILLGALIGSWKEGARGADGKTWAS
jgi:hypothetical protein